MQMQELKSSKDQEMEQRLLFESEFNKIDKAMKQAQKDKGLAEQERDQLKVRIQQMEEEIQYIQKMKRGEISMDSSNSNQEQADQAEDEDQDMKESDAQIE